MIGNVRYNFDPLHVLHVAGVALLSNQRVPAVCSHDVGASLKISTSSRIGGLTLK